MQTVLFWHKPHQILKPTEQHLEIMNHNYVLYLEHLLYSLQPTTAVQHRSQTRAVVPQKAMLVGACCDLVLQDVLRVKHMLRSVVLRL